MTPRIDLNCDLGEGCANDAAIMPWISSANIACGAHAGDETSMRETLLLCRRFGVAAGAHPGYPDREHFGRRESRLSSTEISESIRNQLQQLARIAREEGVVIGHVKPHGALYNQAARDRALADTIAAVVHDLDPSLILVGLADSELPRAGLRAGLRVAHEAFADRRYRSDGSLASRDMVGAVIEDISDSIIQALAIAGAGQIDTLDGARLHVRAQTLCLHGDRIDAAHFAAQVRAALDAAGIRIEGLAAHGAS